MIKKTLLFVLYATLLNGCGSLGKNKDYDATVAFTGEKQQKSGGHLVSMRSGSYATPCINLPFIDKYYPEHLGEVIRIYNPKVDPVGAYKISKMIVKESKKENTHVIDAKSVKLCRAGGEMGFLFKAVAVNKR